MNDFKKITDVLSQEEILEIENRASCVALTLASTRELFELFLSKFRLEFIEKKIAEKKLAGEL